MSIYQTTIKLNAYKRARTLYKQGLPTRYIAKIVGKSNQWVWLVAKGKGIKLLETLNLPDLTIKAKV